jgi:hypothetical protein
LGGDHGHARGGLEPAGGLGVIVSHEHRFIFVKTRKTAGTSVEVYLAKHLGPDAIVTPVYQPEVPGHIARNYAAPTGRARALTARLRKNERRAIQRERWFFNHIGAQAIRARLGTQIWDSYFKFAFERNPWEKTVSDYYFRSANGKERGSFRDYVLQSELPSDWSLYTIDGQIAVDFVGSYADLDADLTRALAQTSWTAPVELGFEKASSRPTDGTSPAAIFDEETSARVAAVFAHEIAQFGYKPPMLDPTKLGLAKPVR